MTAQTLNRSAQGSAFSSELTPDIRAWLNEATSLLDKGQAGKPSEGAALALSLAVSEAQKIIAEQQQRIQTLEHLSHTDELTGVLNRRGFTQEIDRKIVDAARLDHTGAIVYVDLDGFKAVNDTHGHAAGDAVLRRVAAELIEMVRGGDAVGRLGGDEFAVMLARVESSKAGERADQICRQLEQAVVDWNGVSLPIRASVGAVSFDASSTAEAILEAADNAMYNAKRARKQTR